VVGRGDAGKIKPGYVTRSIEGGYLVQEVDQGTTPVSEWDVVTEQKPTEEDLAALDFAWRIVKHVKSNAIVVTDHRRTLGVGAGQMNRVGSVKIALDQAGDNVKGAYLASDAFFPFPDSIEEAAKAGIRAIVQPGGSLKDPAVIEEFLEGQEVSLLCFSDGETALPMVPVQDHKRALDGDLGLNTGGMGTYSPPPIWTIELEATVMRDFVTPTLQVMKERGTPFVGVLFLGLMLTKRGPKLLEYNVRFGDPETQVVMKRLKSDLLPFLIFEHD